MTRFVRWLGLAVVLGAAAVLSFHGLRDLALAVSIPVELAWLLPVAIDAGAAVSCACWLSREVPGDASSFACVQTWLLLGSTVVGNAAQLGMHAAGIVPPWWVAVLVGAIPPAVVGGTVHLAVLVGRPVEQPADETPNPLPGDQQAAAGEPGDVLPPVPDRRALVDVSRDGAIIDDLRALETAHGRRWVRDEVKDMYGIGSDRARRLLMLIGWMPRAVTPGEQAGEGG